MTRWCLNDLQKLFSRLLFLFARFSSETKKSLREERKHTQDKLFFTFFVSLFFLARKPKKLLFSSADRQREKRYKNREHKSADKRDALFLLLLLLFLLAKSVAPIIRAVVRRSFSLFFSRESSGSRWGVF